MNVDILANLTGIDRINAIGAHLEIAPTGTARSRYARLPAQPSRVGSGRAQILLVPPLPRLPAFPPDGDWDSWLILAGRGFGKDPHRRRVGPRAGGIRQSLPRRPRRPLTARSAVRHDRGRVRHHRRMSPLEQAQLRTLQAKALLAQRRLRSRLLITRT